jgi:hypothetical protein
MKEPPRTIPTGKSASSRAARVMIPGVGWP